MRRSQILDPFAGFIGSNLSDHLENANISSRIVMHNGVATSFDVSTKGKEGKEHFGDMSNTLYYGLIRNATVKYGNDTV